MDAIGQLNLKLGDVEAQKFQGRTQALGALRQGVGNVVSDFQKQQVENALAGDFNDIAKVAKEKGVPDTLLTAMAGMWNSAQGRDEKLKIIANLQGIIQAKQEKDKTSGFISKTGTTLSQQGQYAPIPSNASLSQRLASLQANQQMSDDERRKALGQLTSEAQTPEEMAIIEKASGLIAPKSFKGEIESTQKSLTEEEKSKQKVADRLSREAIAKLKADSKRIVDSARKSGLDKASPEVYKTITNNNTTIDLLNKLIGNFDESYVSSLPTSALANFKNKITTKEAANGVIDGDTKAALWWRDLQQFLMIPRHANFGASFTTGESELWNQIVANPSQSSSYVIGALNGMVTQASDQNASVADTWEGYKLPKVKTIAPTPDPVAGGGGNAVKDNSGFIVGKKYKDANGNVATYSGNGKWN